MNPDTPEDNVQEGIEEPVRDHVKEEKALLRKRKLLDPKKTKKLKIK